MAWDENEQVMNCVKTYERANQSVLVAVRVCADKEGVYKSYEHMQDLVGHSTGWKIPPPLPSMRAANGLLCLPAGNGRYVCACMYILYR